MASSTSRFDQPSHQMQKQAISAKEQIASYARDIPISHQDIAKRAFALFEARGATHGLDVQDWLQAGKELLAESQLR